MTTPTLQTLRAQYSSTLKRFIASSKNFEIITSIAVTQSPPPPTHIPDVLYVLDSSFNPPTLAHRRIASTALLENASKAPRLLLLLATQNADKPSKPALFEDRLVMMELFARDLLAYLQPHFSTPENGSLPEIDIGLTKKPYFVDKAAEIDTAGVYPESLEQVHLTGYDTLIRIFNPKYYPPEHTLQPLGPFLTRHRLRVTMRPGSEWGDAEEQRQFLLNMAQGGMEKEGGKPEWAQRIQLVEGRQPDQRPVSSTLAREAIRSNPQDLGGLVPDNVREFILSQQPYSE
ncbi:cytidylyltransferase [Aspergillus nomiae NRRL 13137]|uniref:Cytidylyltransferase n=1 Tax=Aspergillus nomiae NRRL (strain ATCC 15546 / NRRL 13137 / CBS 260.88 / M93) TaxID=1509407 RepID=A0A0L1ITK9_ASPN3|nr:cytidylyltransferase [Aspergillus nomiae NRRL 13137]KNG82824.1 cytidylyltransferase [Aspergillus nomiae NRRL 13137]